MVNESFVVLLPNRNDFDRARHWLGRFDTGLRAGDALHLAIAKNRRADAVHTLDKPMIAAETGWVCRSRQDPSFPAVAIESTDLRVHVDRWHAEVRERAAPGDVQPGRDLGAGARGDQPVRGGGPVQGAVARAVPDRGGVGAAGGGVERSEAGGEVSPHAVDAIRLPGVRDMRGMFDGGAAGGGVQESADSRKNPVKQALGLPSLPAAVYNLAQRPSGPATAHGPAAQRPSGPAAQRPSGPAAQRPSGPAAQRPSGPAAQRPSAQRPSGPAGRLAA